MVTARRVLGVATGGLLMVSIACVSTTNDDRPAPLADAGPDAPLPDVGPSACLGSLTFQLKADEANAEACVGLECGRSWLTILKETGDLLGIYDACPSRCDTCNRVSCTTECAAPRRVPIATEQVTWDGSYQVRSTCGANLQCTATACAARGSYIARVCVGATRPPITDGGATDSGASDSGPRDASSDAAADAATADAAVASTDAGAGACPANVRRVCVDTPFQWPNAAGTLTVTVPR